MGVYQQPPMEMNDHEREPLFPSGSVRWAYATHFAGVITTKITKKDKRALIIIPAYGLRPEDRIPGWEGEKVRLS